MTNYPPHIGSVPLGPKSGTFDPPTFQKYETPMADAIGQTLNQINNELIHNDKKIKIYRMMLFKYIEHNKLNPDCKDWVDQFLKLLKETE